MLMIATNPELRTLMNNAHADRSTAFRALFAGLLHWGTVRPAPATQAA